MIRSLIASVVLTLPAIAFAQSAPLNVRNAPVEHVTACLSQAIGSGELQKVRESIKFFCHGEAASNFFNYLRGKTSHIESYPSSGTYRVRYTNGQRASFADRCYQLIETSDGKAASGAFACEIYLTLGPVINE